MLRVEDWCAQLRELLERERFDSSFLARTTCSRRSPAAAPPSRPWRGSRCPTRPASSTATPRRKRWRWPGDSGFRYRRLSRSTASQSSRRSGRTRAFRSRSSSSRSPRRSGTAGSGSTSRSGPLGTGRPRVARDRDAGGLAAPRADALLGHRRRPGVSGIGGPIVDAFQHERVHEPLARRRKQLSKERRPGRADARRLAASPLGAAVDGRRHGGVQAESGNGGLRTDGDQRAVLGISAARPRGRAWIFPIGSIDCSCNARSRRRLRTASASTAATSGRISAGSRNGCVAARPARHSPSWPRRPPQRSATRSRAANA